MTNKSLNFLSRLQHDEAGQGLVEYVMIFGIVAFGTTAGMGSLASTINSTFVVISTIFGKYIT
jgi:Flp pilus assembly pilin Flp